MSKEVFIDLKYYPKSLAISGNFEDTCSDKLLNLCIDIWVFHSGLACCRVLLHVSEHLHNRWIPHDVLNLGVSNCMRHSLLVVARRSVRLSLNEHHSFLCAILALFIVGVDFESLLEGLHRLVVLFLKLMTCAFSGPALDKLGVQFESLLSILHSSHRLHQLNVCKRAITVDELIGRITLDAFIEFLYSGREVTIFEELVSLFLMGLSDLRVDISQGICLSLFSLDKFESLLDIVIVVFDQCLFVLGDGLIVRAFLEKGIRSTSHSFAELGVIVRTFLGHCYDFVTLLDNLIVFSHFKVDGSQVRVESELLGVQIDCF